MNAIHSNCMEMPVAHGLKQSVASLGSSCGGLAVLGAFIFLHLWALLLIGGLCGLAAMLGRLRRTLAIE